MEDIPERGAAGNGSGQVTHQKNHYPDKKRPKRSGQGRGRQVPPAEGKADSQQKEQIGQAAERQGQVEMPPESEPGQGQVKGEQPESPQQRL